jgi:spermidine synthase
MREDRGMTAGWNQAAGAGDPAIGGPADTRPEVVERVATGRGELALRRVGDQYEIISNGVFLMDTRGGASERLLVRAALDAAPPGARLLIGGLGVGFSLDEAARSGRPGRITVVEVEPALVDWHATHLRRFSGTALADPRVEVVTADLLAWLRGTDGTYEAICLDVDNGPEWTTFEQNAVLYTDAGLALLRSRLVPGGVLAVWSAAASEAFAGRLRARLGDVAVHRVPVARGEPDVVYLARVPATQPGRRPAGSCDGRECDQVVATPGPAGS